MLFAERFSVARLCSCMCSGDMCTWFPAGGRATSILERYHWRVLMSERFWTMFFWTIFDTGENALVEKVARQPLHRRVIVVRAGPAHHALPPARQCAANAARHGGLRAGRATGRLSRLCRQPVRSARNGHLYRDRNAPNRLLLHLGNRRAAVGRPLPPARPAPHCLRPRGGRTRAPRARHAASLPAFKQLHSEALQRHPSASASVLGKQHKQQHREPRFPHSPRGISSLKSAHPVRVCFITRITAPRH